MGQETRNRKYTKNGTTNDRQRGVSPIKPIWSDEKLELAEILGDESLLFADVGC